MVKADNYKIYFNIETMIKKNPQDLDDHLIKTILNQHQIKSKTVRRNTKHFPEVFLTITSIFLWGSTNPFTVNLRSTEKQRKFHLNCISSYFILLQA